MRKRIGAAAARAKTALDVLTPDDENEEDRPEDDQGDDEPGVAGGIHDERNRGGGERQGAQHAGPPNQ